MSQLLIVIPISLEKSAFEDDVSIGFLEIHVDFLGFRTNFLSVLSGLIVFEVAECRESIVPFCCGLFIASFPQLLFLALNELISYYRDQTYGLLIIWF